MSCFIVCSTFLFAQDRPVNGVATSTISNYIFKNATIYISSTKMLQKGSIVVENGIIKEIGTSINKKSKYIEVDCEGLVILPSFIEIDHSFKITATTQEIKNDANRSAEYSWNAAVKPEFLASNYAYQDKINATSWAKKGFGLLMSTPNDGIISGQGYLRSIFSKPEQSSLLNDKAALVFSFEKGSSKQNYPSSQMGSIALLRQTLYDAKAYEIGSHRFNASLEALNSSLKNSPVLFKTKDAVEILRAKKIAEEFNLNWICIGGNDAYKFVAELKSQNIKMAIPLNFPKAYNVSDPYVNQYIPLGDLKDWEMSPANATILQKAGIPIAFTTDGIESEKDFWNAIRSVVKHGLSPMEVLRALTETPAKWLGVDKEYGTLEVGKKAFFTIYSENPLNQETEVLEVFNNGVRELINPRSIENLEGKYNFNLENKQYPIEIVKKDAKSYEVKRLDAPKKVYENVKINVEGLDIHFVVGDSTDVHKGHFILHGKFIPKMGVFEGEGTSPSGNWIRWTAIKQKKTTPDTKVTTIKVDTLVAKNIWFPNMAYGQPELPKAKNYLFKNVNVWTNEVEGQLKNGFVLVKEGKISYVGLEQPKLPTEVEIIDGSGKFLTSGIIDEHSHIAISKGVNEGGQSVTSEVSIADVVRNDDINIYRQLAGGVTTSQLLHGSANTIGGQSALIKLKWGYAPEQMLYKDAPKFIKFALGENVKQTNWGDGSRFPQSRMGVEQVLVDAFSRAQKYKVLKSSKSKDFNVDLELEALVEILDGKRHITCHSYIQSEIIMLLQVADSFGFKINTLTHALEAYKLADLLKKHGVGASTFADWWAYKYEVMDAIPQNASLLNEQGVLVAINSDDAEMGRRLNQEAAKAIKYGNMSEEDAWKLVTLNPAKLLKIDDKVGSIKVGKDADLVLWNTNPLSVMAIPESVFIDGILFFNRTNDLKAQLQNERERARIINKMLEENHTKNENGKEFKVKDPKFFHCNTLGEEGTNQHNNH